VGRLDLWETGSWARRRTLKGPSDPIWAFAWSPDSTAILSLGDNNQVLLWNARTGAITRTLEGLGGPGTAVAWSPDGRLVAGVTTDQALVLWNPATGAVVQRYQPGLALYAAAFAPDSRTLAVGGGDDAGGRTLMWRVAP
jgi:WD40 repeat protein